MVKDWLANAYGGMSRREFLAQVGVTGIGLAGGRCPAPTGYRGCAEGGRPGS